MAERRSKIVLLVALLLAVCLGPVAEASLQPPTRVEPPPRVVILIHGILFPGSPDMGEPVFARRYWSRDFVLGLLGGDQSTRLVTLADTAIDIPGSWRRAGENPGERFIAVRREPDAQGPPPVTVMMPSRNGTRGFLRQCQDTIREIDQLDGWYRQKYGVEPEFIVIGHSMGGLVARFLLTDPDPRSYADLSLNPEEIRFDSGARTAMTRLRGGCVRLITIGAPHEGTSIADNGELISEKLRSGLDRMNGHQKSLLGNGTRSLLETFGGAIEGVTERPVDSEESARLVTQAVEQVILDLRGAQYRDLTTTYWLRMNQEVLRPDRMRRPPASRLNGPRLDDDLIPVHVFAGRTPGGKPFSTLNPARNLKAMVAAERLVLVLAEVFADMCQRTIAGGWGDADPARFGRYAKALDRVERITLTGLVRATTGMDLDQRLSDAFGPGIGGVLAQRMGWLELSFPVYLDRRWTFDMGGQIQVPVPYLLCTTIDYDLLSDEAREKSRLALDQVQLREALKQAFGSFQERVDRTEGMSLESLLELLRATGSLSEDSARSLGELFKEGGKVALSLAREFGPDAARCVDPRNWTIRHIQMVVPSPRPIATNEPVADGEIDADGPVPMDSALGLFLGTDVAGAFDHKLPGGSWHRYTASPFDREGHISQTKGHHLGAFLEREFLRD